jgi:hypothetical protein
MPVGGGPPEICGPPPMRLTDASQENCSNQREERACQLRRRPEPEGLHLSIRSDLGGYRCAEERLGVPRFEWRV